MINKKSYLQVNKKRKFYIGKELRIPILYSDNENCRERTDKVAGKVSEICQGWKFVFDRIEELENNLETNKDFCFREFVYKMVKEK